MRYTILDRTSRFVDGEWDRRQNNTTNRFFRYYAPQYKFRSTANNYFDGPYGESKFEFTQGQKLFFGTVKLAGQGVDDESFGTASLPAFPGNEEMWVHIPNVTFTSSVSGFPVKNGVAAIPIPVLPDSEGRFGLVLPSGTPYIYVKMTGTLWRKVVFGTGTDTIQTKFWNGATSTPTQILTLRMGDVNEDNVIKVGTTEPADLAYLTNRIGGRVTLLNDGVPRIYIYDLPCDLNRDNKVDQDDYDNYDTLLRPTSNVPGAEFTP